MVFIFNLFMKFLYVGIDILGKIYFIAIFGSCKCDPRFMPLLQANQFLSVYFPFQLNSEAPNEEDASLNVTDSAPDTNVSEDNATPIKEELELELESEQDDPTGNVFLCVQKKKKLFNNDFNFD